MASATPSIESMSQLSLSHRQDSPSSNAPPLLPAEIWLQILEHHANDSLSHLWTTIRPLSKTYKAHVERIFIYTYLPTLTLSLSLPRYDPKSNMLNYPFALPLAEINFQASSLVNDTDDDVVLRSQKETSVGDTMERLKEEGKVTKKRLDSSPGLWVWFGTSRGKGGTVKMPIDVSWDDEEKVWKMTVAWRTLTSSLFEGKTRRVERALLGRRRGNAPGLTWRSRK
ncbi:hypothetical protein CC80DRAFT_3510 [Byssothecium circinans]|uniref:Uncharacterized protein n=1 Tax=Byssothecium circinans TaxID=147558 RepID=A0A6A5UF54_9PLEO|nr:hypothetical protein CC80DRAFT_3510 [Byssothecium circinans]